MPKLIKKFNKEFYQQLIETSGNLGVKPEDLLLVFTLESGLDPSSKTSHTVGLNQFYGNSFQNYFKGTKDEYAALKAEEQLPYIEKFFRSAIGGVKIRSAAQLYIANFLPAILKDPGIKAEDRDAIIAQRGDFSRIGGIKKDKIWSQNPALDYNKDGKITYGDIVDKLESLKSNKVYRSAVEDLESYRRGNFSDSYDYQHDNTSKTKEDFIKEDKDLKKQKIISFIKKFKSYMEKKMPRIGKTSSYNLKNNIIIKISSKDLTDNLEFSRILSTACEDVLSLKSKIYTNGKDVEVKISDNNQKNIFLIKKLSQEVLNNFNEITKVKSVFVDVFLDEPSYKELDLKTAQRNYRKFQLKMIGK